MSFLWEFISAFPPTQGKRRIPFFLRQDLRWWCSTLPSHNGILFFDDDVARPPIQLYTDACLTGIRGFFYSSLNRDWRANIPLLTPTQAFTAEVEEPNRKEHINFHKVYAILIALQRWGTLYSLTP